MSTGAAASLPSAVKGDEGLGVSSGTAVSLALIFAGDTEGPTLSGVGIGAAEGVVVSAPPPSSGREAGSVS